MVDTYEIGVNAYVFDKKDCETGGNLVEALFDCDMSAEEYADSKNN